MNRWSVAVAVSIVNACACALAGAQDIPVEDKTIGGNAKQRYLLIGDTKAKAPDAGFGLLLVIPGGDGSGEFHPFVKNIAAKAVPDGYLVAQLVAVPTMKQDQIVWPTAKLKDPKQTFSTESFVAAVVKDVKSAHKINDAHVFTLSWSSGGFAAYAVSVAKDSPVRGSFIAMSVFPEPQVKADLARAKGHRYYLLQSRGDMVTKFFHAENAKKKLTDAGATVELIEYQGPHGWHGDVFGNIRKGIEWLESEPTSKPDATPSAKPAAK